MSAKSNRLYRVLKFYIYTFRFKPPSKHRINTRSERFSVPVLDAGRNFFTEHRRKQWQELGYGKLLENERKFGTVGAVARYRRGNLAAATSTGGTMGKRAGRIGDSPIVQSALGVVFMSDENRNPRPGRWITPATATLMGVPGPFMFIGILALSGVTITWR